MTALSVPQDGLVLLRTPDPCPPSHPAVPPQVLRLNLAQKATQEILKSFQNNEKISIRFGRRVIVQHGNKVHSVFAYPELYPSELYRRSTDGENTFYFSGKLSHRLEAQKAQTDTAKVDEALTNLENTLKSYEEQKTSNEARFVTDRDELRHLTVATQKGKGHQLQPVVVRKDRLLNTISRSTPSSPFLGAAYSPANGPLSSTRSIPASPSRDQIRLNAIKIPLLHLLAVKPLQAKTLVATLRATKEDCEKLLHRYAKDVGDTSVKQELKDKAYRELDLWKFPYPREDDRQAAIDRTISAFDRMRISPSDQIWETLLPVKERGKGKGSEMSRLKLGHAGVTGGTPKPGSSVGRPNSVADTGTDLAKPAGKAKGSTTRAKPRSNAKDNQDRNAALNKEMTKQSNGVHGKDMTRNEKRKSQPSGKFKSSEVIDDSDEELERADAPVEGTTKSIKGSNTRPKTSAVSPSSKSVGATGASEPLPSPRKTAVKVASSLMPNSVLSRPRSESATNKSSPRPRTESSPQKPSPLASSPTNATDLDNFQSSKPNSLSSATSSPATSPRRYGGQKTPAVSKTLEPRQPGIASKRKAEDHPLPAAKRRQGNGNPATRPTTNGAGISYRGDNNTTDATSIPGNAVPDKATITTTASNRSRGPSASSASTSTTASSLTATNTSSSLQSDLQLKSRRFQTQYARYKALHAKIMAIPESERDVEEIKGLRKMHVRIGELKKEIWEGWEKKKLG